MQQKSSKETSGKTMRLGNKVITFENKCSDLQRQHINFFNHYEVENFDMNAFIHRTWYMANVGPFKKKFCF